MTGMILIAESQGWPVPCRSCVRDYYPEDGDNGECFICRLDRSADLASECPPTDLHDLVPCGRCPTCWTLRLWGPALSGRDADIVQALTISLRGAPRLRRAVPPGSRWWCEPASDTTRGPIGQRTCAGCFNSVPGAFDFCDACQRRASRQSDL